MKTDNTFAFTDECNINYDFLQKLLRFNKSYNIYDYEIYNEMKIPNRKHKQKRIAKKWLKRYGYHTIQAKSDWKLSKYSDNDGINEFILVKS